MCIRPDGHILAAENRGMIELLRVEGSVVSPLATLRGARGDRAHDGDMEAIAFNTEGTLLATACSFDEERRLKIWDAVDRRLLFTLPVSGNNPVHPAFSPDGKESGRHGGR